MHLQDTAELGERLAVEEVGGEQVAVFCRQGTEGALDGARKLRELCLGRLLLGGRRGGLRVVEGLLAVSAAMAVDVALGEGGAQPAEQGAPA